MLQNLQLLKCPIIPNKCSYEIISEGPVSIWYYGKNETKTDYFAFQISREVIPMLLTTINHQTSIIAQSSLPIYIPFNTNIVVDGKKVQLYLGEGCRITNKANRNKYIISNAQFEIPKSNIIVIHCANVKELFHDVIQVILTDEMVAYCAGKNCIQLSTSDTEITVLQQRQNLVQ